MFKVILYYFLGEFTTWFMYWTSGASINHGVIWFVAGIAGWFTALITGVDQIAKN